MTNHKVLGLNIILPMKDICEAGEIACKCKCETEWNGGQWNPNLQKKNISESLMTEFN